MKIEKKTMAVAVLLFAAVAVMGLQTLSFDFNRLDDNLYVFENAAVSAGLGWTNFKEVATNLIHGGIWMPLTSLTYMLDISLFGPSPGVHHYVNWIFHGLNAVLVFFLFVRLVGRRFVFAAAVAAALWAFHPQRCESVAWIASRKDVVFTLLFMLGIHLWVPDPATRRVRPVRAALAYLAMLLSCTAKPTAMVFPAVAFAVEWFALGAEVKRDFRRRLVKYLPLVLIAAATAALAVYSQTHSDEEDFEFVRGLNEGYGSFTWRCFNAAIAIGLYSLQTVVPWNLHIEYRAFPDAVPAGALPGMLVFAAIVAVLVIMARRRRGGAALWSCALWYIAALGPTLGIAGGFGAHARADRFLYLPMIGVSLYLAHLLATHPPRRWVRAVLVGAVLFYAGSMYYNNRFYRDNFTFFGRVMDVDPDHFVANSQMATDYAARFNDLDKSVELFRRALAQVDNDEQVMANYVAILAMRGRREDHAEIRLRCRLLAERPELDDRGIASEALGTVEMRERNWDQAIRLFAASAAAPRRRSKPDTALIQMAMCRFNKGDLDGAEKEFRILSTKATVPKVRERARQAMQQIWAIRANAGPRLPNGVKH